MPDAVVSLSVAAATFQTGLTPDHVAPEKAVPGVNETGPDRTTELGEAAFCPMVTVPVDVPVLMLVAKLLLTLIFVVAPIVVIPKSDLMRPAA